VKAKNTPKAAPAKTDAKKGATSNTANKPKTTPATPNTQKKADTGKTPAANTNPDKKAPNSDEPNSYIKSCEKPSEVLKLFVGDTKTLIGQKTNMSTGTICDGINRDPCCTTQVYDQIKSFWKADVDLKSPDSLMSRYTRNLNSIIYYKYRQTVILSYYVQMSTKTLNDIPKDVRSALSFLSNKAFPGMQLRNVEESGGQCWSHLSNVIKGTYCKACDRSESNLRFSQNDLWKIS